MLSQQGRIPDALTVKSNRTRDPHHSFSTQREVDFGGENILYYTVLLA